jgi:predicted kinase
VIFSNQSRSSPKLIEKIVEVITSIGLPIFIYIALKDDEYRKPNIGMWKLFRKSYPHPFEHFTFVGDAAGRSSDFSDSDLMFLENVRVSEGKSEGKFSFKTPEEYFIEKGSNIPIPDVGMIILIGYPASGKSTFARCLNFPSEITRFQIVSRDILKTKEKCYAMTRKLLSEKKKVVIDNLNANSEDRAEYIKIAKEAGIKVIAIHFNTSMEESMLRNEKRGREYSVPKIVYYTYRKRYEPATLEEGFDQILEV